MELPKRYFVLVSWFTGFPCESFPHRPRDPALGCRQFKQQRDRRRGVVSINGRFDLIAPLYPWTCNNPRDFDFFHRRSAVAFGFAAVVSGHEYHRLLANAGPGERLEQVANQSVHLLDSVKILG